MQLPEAFCSRMKEMLGDTEFEHFIKSYDFPKESGLRVNTDKITCEEFEKIAPFPIQKIPWTSNGYFYSSENKPGHSPYYQAGLYYLQEPSAMTPASRIPVQPGEYVLDMCAAPGGKSTALGNLLKGEGLLVSNDISASRCKALLRNIELFGIPNAIITNEPPENLIPYFPEFFHKIVLDAPCSGEGMFRKEEAMAADWTPEKSESIAEIQRSLVSSAVKMLRPGGFLLYSTCTFAPVENEGTISYLLEKHPEMSLAEMKDYEGFSHGNPAWGNQNPALSRCVRIFPHKMNGEGHFLALLQKRADSVSAIDIIPEPSTKKAGKKKKKEQRSSKSVDPAAISLLKDFLQEIGLSAIAGIPVDFSRIEIHADKVYYLPPVSVETNGITFLRKGIFLGDLKKNRFEPSQPFALAIHKGDCTAVVTLSADDPRIRSFLKGESFSLLPGDTSCTKGWVLVTIEGYALGWGKIVNQTLKNKYPAGWRIP